MNNEFLRRPQSIVIEDSHDVTFGNVVLRGPMDGMKVSRSSSIHTAQYLQISPASDLREAMGLLSPVSDKQLEILLHTIVQQGASTDVAAVETAMKANKWEAFLAAGESLTTIATNIASFLSTEAGQHALAWAQRLLHGGASAFGG